MIDGRRGGSGPYSYRGVTKGNRSVMVAHMPEDDFSVRIVFKHMGEVNIPIIKLNDMDAEMLWAALNLMAKDLKWDDRMVGDIAKDMESEK